MFQHGYWHSHKNSVADLIATLPWNELPQKALKQRNESGAVLAFDITGPVYLESYHSVLSTVIGLEVTWPTLGFSVPLARTVMCIIFLSPCLSVCLFLHHLDVKDADASFDLNSNDVDPQPRYDDNNVNRFEINVSCQVPSHLCLLPPLIRGKKSLSVFFCF